MVHGFFRFGVHVVVGLTTVAATVEFIFEEAPAVLVEAIKASAHSAFCHANALRYGRHARIALPGPVVEMDHDDVSRDALVAVRQFEIAKKAGQPAKTITRWIRRLLFHSAASPNRGSELSADAMGATTARPE